MQSVSSRIWTRVAVSISDDDNHYITGTSKPWNDSRSRRKKIDRASYHTRAGGVGKYASDDQWIHFVTVVY